MAQDSLRAGDPGIVVAENARVFLISGRIRADFAEIQIILRVSGLVKDDTEFAVEAVLDALERFFCFARFFADPGHDAHALRLNEDLALVAFLAADGLAESVFIAGMFVKYGSEYADLCDHRSLPEEAAEARAAIAEVEQAALTAGWDGAWFRRAYDAFGQPIGSKECDEGQIFIEPQGMCVMAGIGKTTGQAEQALRSVEERLDTRYGIVLLQPAYTTYRLNLGEISSYPPGYKENAGIFCHNNPWISCAETVLGHGDRAFEVYKKTCPAYIEDISEIHRTEPYVYSQMVAGIDAPTFGEAKNSWLTGTAAWTFFNVSQYILGVQPTLDGLKIDPCIPHTLSGFTVTRRYRGAVYHIRVENPDAVQKGVKRVTVNGSPIPGNVLPIAAPGETVEVTVVMG